MTLFPREYMTRRALLPALSDPDVERAAEKLNRGFGQSGWGARIYLGDLRIDG